MIQFKTTNSSIRFLNWTYLVFHIWNLDKRIVSDRLFCYCFSHYTSHTNKIRWCLSLKHFLPPWGKGTITPTTHLRKAKKYCNVSSYVVGWILGLFLEGFQVVGYISIKVDHNFLFVSVLSLSLYNVWVQIWDESG